MSPFKLAILCSCLPSLLSAQTITLTRAAQSNLAISLYSQDLALVQDSRRLGPLSADDLVIVKDISQQLHPQTLRIDKAGTITEQSLNKDIISYRSLIDLHIGKNIILAKSTASGIELKQQVKLLSADKTQALIENQGAIETVPLNSNLWRLIFPDSANKLPLAPSLTFKSQGKKGTNNIQLNYLTSGLHWQMDYVLELNPKRDRLQLKGLASLYNNTSTLFENASIKLIAGNIAMPAKPINSPVSRAMMMNTQSSLARAPDIGDLKQYPLKAPLTLNPHQQLQVPLIQGANIKVAASYQHSTNIYPRMDSTTSIRHPKSQLVFINSSANGMGIALARGVARVFQADKKGQLQFIGANQLNASSANQRITLTTGEAFDLSITQRQISYKQTFDGSLIGTQFIINNSAAQARTLELSTRFNQEWEIISSTFATQRTSSASAHWQLEIAANSSLVFTVNVRLKHRK